MNEPFLSLPIADGIPEKRARFLFRVRSEKARADDEQLAATQSHGVLSQKRYMEITGNKVVAALAGTDNFNHVDQDDFVISLRTFEGGIERAKEPGCISPAYTVLAPSKDVEPTFFQYLLKSQVFVSHLQTTVTGIRDGKSVKFENFANIVLPVPNLATQRQIADFLDRETARIDLLIEKKQKLVTLLKAQRAAAISSGVTVGLNEDPQLVATSSQHLPSVPKTWRVWRLKHLGEIRGGLTLGRKIPDNLETTPTPYMRVANVQAGRLNLSDVAEIPVTEDEKKRYRLQHGDVLMNEGGDNDKLGRGAVWKSEIDNCVHQNHVFAFRPYDTRFSEWISLATNALYARDFFYLHSNQSTNLASISKTNLSRLPIALPPIDEMQATLGALWDRVEKLDRITEKTTASIDRLKEYRSALITAAVTGQIDVSTYAKSGTTDRRLDAIQEEMGA